MGLYQRENGYFYIQIREDNKYKRVSLETKHKYIAQELYNAYLLDKVKSKLYKSQYHSNSHTHQDSIQSNQIEEPKTLIKPIYQQYLNQENQKILQHLFLLHLMILLKSENIFVKHKYHYC